VGLLPRPALPANKLFSMASPAPIDNSPWKKGPRDRRDFEAPPPPDVKPSVKTLESDLRRQVRSCYEQVERDLDLLHEQVFREIHGAITAELLGVAQNMQAIRREFADCTMELRRITDDRFAGLGADVAEIQRAAQDAHELRMRDVREASSASKEVQEALIAVSAHAGEALRTESTALHAEITANSEDVRARLRQIESAVDERLTADAAEKQRLEAAEARLTATIEDIRREDQQALNNLTTALRDEVLKNAESRHSDVDSVAVLERSFERRLNDAAEALVARNDAAAEALEGKMLAFANNAAERHTELKAWVKEVSLEVDNRLNSARQDFSDRLGFAESCWARLVEWTARPDLSQLEREGQCEMDSPTFSAAGLDMLQLRLRIGPASGERWAVGAFLRAPRGGQVSFRLRVASRVMSFAGDFTGGPELGSQRIAVLDNIGQKLIVRLEILDVVAQLAPAGWPQDMQATLQIVDAAQVASHEAEALRSRAVRRIEWRVSRISERLRDARAASASSVNDGEALEPICSPLFAAAGLDGLQLQLYPLGYRPRGDEGCGGGADSQCGFFLVCPTGTHIKCRAFIGDSIRTFEHHYDTHEPYGRGSFCRLTEKVGDDDSVVCGVEFLEVRQELTTQVRGGPFGNIVDQMKLTLVPSSGAMETVREIRDKEHHPRSLGRQRGAHANPASCSGPKQRHLHAHTKSVTAGGDGGLTSSKSLPTLAAPVGGSPYDAGLVSGWAPQPLLPQSRYGKTLPRI